jgi:hypothetical protein
MILVKNKCGRIVVGSGFMDFLAGMGERSSWKD